MIVQVTYNNDFGGTPHAAAEVNAPTNNINEALEYAFRWTQNITGSWSKKIGGDANDNVKVLYHNFDGSGLRSSMVGDEFLADGKIFKCMPMGFKEIG